MYDVIVIGTGGIGSAALDQVAGRGATALGLDRHPPAHDKGSSHGHTRMIRRAYFEHPDYVPLLDRSYALWADLEEERGVRLYHETGVLQVGPGDGVVVPGVLRSAADHDLDVEELTAGDVAERFPGFGVPDGSVGVFEPGAGYLLVEDAVRAQLDRAQQRGAELRTGVAVTHWSSSVDGVTVSTDAGDFEADHLIIAAGAWADGLLGDLGLPLRVLRKHLHWYHTDDERYREDAGAPSYLYELADGFFYGFPSIEGRGVKVGEHSGGEPVGDPSSVDRSLDPADRARVERFVTGQLPGVGTTSIGHAVCMYTVTPDEHFVVDRHPLHPSVAFAAGMSGHGFKFAPVLGEVLADLVLGGATPLPVGFLGLDRWRD